MRVPKPHVADAECRPRHQREAVCSARAASGRARVVVLQPAEVRDGADRSRPVFDFAGVQPQLSADALPLRI